MVSMSPLDVLFPFTVAESFHCSGTKIVMPKAREAGSAAPSAKRVANFMTIVLDVFIVSMVGWGVLAVVDHTGDSKSMGKVSIATMLIYPRLRGLKQHPLCMISICRDTITPDGPEFQQRWQTPCNSHAIVPLSVSPGADDQVAPKRVDWWYIGPIAMHVSFGSTPCKATTWSTVLRTCYKQCLIPTLITNDCESREFPFFPSHSPIHIPNNFAGRISHIYMALYCQYQIALGLTTTHITGCLPNK
jgi:hypothetical protein